MQTAATAIPVVKDLVLVGGGHSHVAVLKRFGMNLLPGVRLTLICKDAYTPYSGMLPGLIAGHYTFEEAHIDLRPLCHFAGAQFYHDAVTGIDLQERRILCARRPPVSFDLLSINTGSTPRARDIPGALKYTLPVKPIDRFLNEWDNIIHQLAETTRSTWRIVVVGGGAGGVELTLATRHRLLSQIRNPEMKLQFDLVTQTDTILPTHNRRVQAAFEQVLKERNIRVHLRQTVTSVEPGLLHCQSSQSIPFDIALWVTNAAPAPWIAASGLRTDPAGFIVVTDALQSVSHPFVFAAGDIASVENHPRPKSGVFAVRQGRRLAENLRLALLGQTPRPFRPQRDFLSLISTGDRYAIGSRGRWAIKGDWVWRLKDWIDRRWMRQYQELPAPPEGVPTPTSTVANAELLRELGPTTARCGGCGAKISSQVLSRVLKRLPQLSRPDVLVGLEAPDDAAVTIIPPDKVSVQTVDFFRPIINDPFVFGQIAAIHCLGDIFAMGAEPRSALALAMLPYAAESRMEEQLYQLMAGITEVLASNQTVLAGGHTAEGAELVCGLVVQGIADPARLLRKSGLRPGDQLILTKPIGTGALFAADMRRQAKSSWIESALAVMLQSNRNAAICLQRYPVSACTDVTGFGLAGHLLEMVQASAVQAVLSLDQIPLLPGAREVTAAGIVSSLQPQNARHRNVGHASELASDPRFPLLFDPQTAGGLLAGVPATSAHECVAELKRIGYSQAAIIGRVEAPGSPAVPLIIQT